MTSKKTILILSLALCLSSFPALAATPPKPSASCTKLGITKDYNGKTYKCIKSGKKLVWNKGIVIKTAAPAATPTPNSSSTSTPTPSPNTTLKLPLAGDPPLPFDGCGFGWYYYRINNGVMERSFYPDKGYVASDSRPNSSFDSVRVNAYEAIRNHKSTNMNLPTIDYRVSQGFPKDIFSYLKEQLETQMAYWSDRFKPNAKVIATFTTEMDVSILSPETTSNYEDALEVAKVYADPIKNGYVSCGWRNGISGAHTLWNGPNYGSIGFWIVFPSYHNGNYWLPKNLPHEITHGIQDLMWITSDYPSGTKNVYNLIEGGAEIFGTALSHPNIGWYNDAITSMIVSNYLGDKKNQIFPQNVSDILSMLSVSERNDNGLGSTWAYTVGFHLWEYVIANYGFDSYWSIVRNVQSASSYDDTIKVSLGISKAQLYENAAPYILKQFKIALSSYDNK